MRFEVCGVDHQLIPFAALCSKRREEPVEHAHAAPADEPVVDCLRLPVCRRCVPPAQAIADHEDDAADDPTIIDPLNPVRQPKMRLYPAICASDNQIRSLMATPTCAAIESTLTHLRKQFNGS